jgi:hypothetical protein
MRADWLPQVLRDAGLDVYVMPGASVRGRDMDKIRGVVAHHTATGPNWSDGHVAALLRDGRRDLKGPLSQLGLERDGTFVVVATGKANHNGYGEWGNDSIGIEAYNSGLGELWPKVQLDAYVRGSAAILRHLRYDSSRVKGHRETDPKRKIDPAGIDMDRFRRAVQDQLNGPTAPTPEDDDMGTYLRNIESGDFVHVYGERFRVMKASHYAARKFIGAPAAKDMHPWAIAKFVMDFGLLPDPELK